MDKKFNHELQKHELTSKIRKIFEEVLQSTRVGRFLGVDA